LANLVGWSFIRRSIRMKLTGKPKLHVQILSPTQTYYDGMALSVSATNKVGPFDILADHANFFSLLDSGTVTVINETQTLKFPVSKGLVRVHNNVILLFVDIEPATTSHSHHTTKN
jgi:F0F1-type ATP synthase epsilon subunit